MFGNQDENSYSGFSLEFISHPCTCHELGGGEGASIEITHFPFFFLFPHPQEGQAAAAAALADPVESAPSWTHLIFRLLLLLLPPTRCLLLVAEEYELIPFCLVADETKLFLISPCMVCTFFFFVRSLGIQSPRGRRRGDPLSLSLSFFVLSSSHFVQWILNVAWSHSSNPIVFVSRVCALAVPIAQLWKKKTTPACASPPIFRLFCCCVLFVCASFVELGFIAAAASACDFSKSACGVCLLCV